MEIVHFDEKQVTGICIRTNNANEMQSETSKLDGLWQSFHEKVFDSLKSDATVYSVYFDYESDATGDYSVLVGSDQIDELSVNGAGKVSIQSGNYLEFPAKGDMPQVVIETWSKIWEYFSDEGSEHQRAFTTDFELYKGPDEIEIYIAIQ